MNNQEHFICNTLKAINPLLEAAYLRACSQGKAEEPWAVALADSLHYAREAMEKLEQEVQEVQEQP